MKKLNLNEFAKNINFGKGKLESIEDVLFYLKNGYKPERLLLNFKCSDKVLQIIFSHQAINNKN